MAKADIESVLTEHRVFPPAAEFSAQAHVPSLAEYERLASAAAADPQGFWSEIAKQLDWFAPWRMVLEWKPPFAKWFVGGTTNLSHNCIDRHLNS